MKQQLLFGVGPAGASPIVRMESTNQPTAERYSKARHWLDWRPSRELLLDAVWAFTDGSSTGWHSAVLLFPKKKIVKVSRHKEPTSTRNVGAELNGMLLGLKRVKTTRQVYLVHDYFGVGAWMTGNWKIKDQEVRSAIDQGKALIAEKKLDVRFIHHGGHQKTDDDFTYWNREADRLCSGRKRITEIRTYEEAQRRRAET